MVQKKDYTSLVGSCVNNLLITGPCQGGFRTPKGQAERKVPCRCVRCGREDFWKKGDITKGRANCSCHRKTRNGLSDTHEGSLHNLARRRALRANVPFKISVEDISIPETCPILGVPLERGRGGTTDRSPTLDRLVPELGYVPGNVFVVSHLANRIKSSATLQQIEAVAQWVREQKKGQPKLTP